MQNRAAEMAHGNSRPASAGTENVWWHRRIVLVSEDSTWISSMLDSLPARTGVAEGVTWEEAIRLTGPIGAMVCHIDRPRSLAESVLRAYEHWWTLAWQPCTLTWMAPRPGAARIREALRRHRFPAICTPEFNASGGRIRTSSRSSPFPSSAATYRLFGSGGAALGSATARSPTCAAITAAVGRNSCWISYGSARKWRERE